VPTARNHQTNAVRGNAPFAAASHCKRGEDDGGEEDGNQAHLLVYESGAAPGPAESQAFHIKPLGVAAAALTIVASAVAASSAHFVGNPTLSRNGNTLTVSGKVAGLGDVDAITVTVSADAQCVNPGSNKPKGENKQGFSAQGDSRSRTGRQALCSQDLTATFQPDCTPPMTVEFSNVVVTVTAADGTFLQFTF
jgi:hypothetical protein